jgi:hypothetical protein
MENPQITKARSKNYKPEIIEFFRLSMLVGISEAIRLLSTLSSKMMNDLIYNNKLKIKNPEISSQNILDNNNKLKSVKVTNKNFNE